MKHYLPPELMDPNGPVDIILVGAGGTGSQLLSGLARMHFALSALGHPGLFVHTVDGDTVSAANVGRQLFSPADIGRNKAELLTARVNLFFGLGWNAYPEMVDKKAWVLNSHAYAGSILITAVDKAESRKLAATAFKDATYWLDTGNTANTGQVVLGTGHPQAGCHSGGYGQVTVIEQPKKAKDAIGILPTVLDLYPDMKKQDTSAKQGPSCSVAQALQRQDLFINQMVATSALQILWQAFRKGYLTEHGAFINLNPLSVRPLPVDPEGWKRMGWTIK